MANYLIRRLYIGALTLVFVSFILMALIRAMPGDPVKLMAMANERTDARVTQKLMEDMRKTYGLDVPWYKGYFYWLLGREGLSDGVVRGDFGRSIYDQKLVTERIGERIGPTLTLSLLSIALVYSVSIPLGLYATSKNGKWQEQLISTLLYMLYSIPGFVLALFLLLLFAVKLKVMPLRGMQSDPEIYDKLSAPMQVWDRFHHLILPLFCYSHAGLAYLTRFIRSNMLEVIRQDYIRTARAKGVDEPTVFYHHAFRNTLIPLVTLLGLSLPGLLSGSVILEQIFGWPGMGSLFFEAIRQRDYPVIMGLTMTFSTLVLSGNLLADILYAVVDPRITYK